MEWAFLILVLLIAFNVRGHVSANVSCRQKDTGNYLGAKSLLNLNTGDRI